MKKRQWKALLQLHLLLLVKKPNTEESINSSITCVKERAINFSCPVPFKKLYLQKN